MLDFIMFGLIALACQVGIGCLTYRLMHAIKGRWNANHYISNTWLIPYQMAMLIGCCTGMWALIQFGFLAFHQLFVIGPTLF
jgi:hypothetical protein